MMVKTCFQPRVVTTMPMMGANSTWAKYWAELKIAEATPRSWDGNQAATMRLLAGNDGPSAMPSMSRSANSTGNTMPMANSPT